LHFPGARMLKQPASSMGADSIDMMAAVERGNITGNSIKGFLSTRLRFSTRPTSRMILL